MICHAIMSASNDCLLESEVRTRELGPQVVFEPTTRSIVAATDGLQDSDFHSRRAKALWNSSLVCSDRACQGEQVQAFRCYEHDPPTSRRLVTNFRAAECPLLPKRILRCCRADEGRLFYTTFAGAKALARREPTG